MANNQREDFRYMLNVIKNPKHKSTKEAITSIQALRSSIKSLKDQGVSPEQIYKVKYSAYDAIKLDLLQNNLAEKAELENKLNIIKDSWEHEYSKNYENNSRRVEAYKRKINAMMPSELKKEVSKINGENPLAYLPAELDELSIAVKQNCPDELLGLRDVINNHNLNSPWLHNDIAKDIVGDLDYLNKNPRDILIKTEDNKRVMMNIEDIEQMFDVEAEDAGEE